MIEPEAIAYNAEEIKQIIENTEYIQRSNESRYTKEQSKVSAYEAIVELLRGEAYECGGRE